MEHESKEKLSLSAYTGFILFLAFFVISLAIEMNFLYSIAFIILAAISHPNKAWREKLSDLGGSILTWIGKGIMIVIGLAIFLGIAMSVSSVFKPTEYEGQTAEEWYNDYSEAISTAEEWEEKYEELSNCVTDFSYLDISDQIDYGGVDSYCN